MTMLPIAQAAAAMRIPERTVRRWIDEAKLDRHLIGGVQHVCIECLEPLADQWHNKPAGTRKARPRYLT